MSRRLADYLRQELARRDWSGRTLARYADVAPDTIAGAMRGDRTPEPDTLRKIARALRVDESFLLRLAGHLEEPSQQLTDARAIAIARRLESLPPEVRAEAIRTVNAQLDMADSLTERIRSDEAPRDLPERARRSEPEAEEEEHYRGGEGDQV
ncbi:MAG: helix-turn-helix domain-containing protein [Ardenticatenaceae bacterium]